MPNTLTTTFQLFDKIDDNSTVEVYITLDDNIHDDITTRRQFDDNDNITTCQHLRHIILDKITI
uniref:Uncharacterized protein n=1 Tax=Meloidogyne incognita TaxID=6306 RepID=A0A914L5A4_MELIC